MGGAVAAVCRNEHGTYVGSSSLVILGVLDPSIFEALACRGALSLAEDLLLHNFISACDSKQVVQDINKINVGHHDSVIKVPNPLFDLAGILCGQFNVPFWKFFLATLIGKAIIKVYMQTTLVITLCNNQLLELVEERLVWVLSNFPGVSSMLPSLVTKLKTAKDKFLMASVAASASSAAKGNKWNLSFSLIWNTVVWLMIVNFLVQIITSTAQNYLKKQQELEISMKSSATISSASEPAARISN
ncbi:hypothetical protein D1007_60766 [Hordeum vulgare]|nr:hypothetical protein D1007_60766 [Hordeum vulgare]